MSRYFNLGTLALVGVPTAIGASIMRKAYFSTAQHDNPTRANNGEDMILASLGLDKKAHAHAISGDSNVPLNIPSRADVIKSLSAGEEYDVLIIGGGASGVGCALDAATRGLKTAIVEREDFASGTSSRSTKLVHGGVRYLENAFKNLDKSQYDLVCEAVTERKTFLTLAPHLTREIPIMLPIYKIWQVPYFWAGSKLYDWVASRKALTKSYYLTKRKAIEAFPMMKSKGLVGAMVYYDGQHNDSRMAVTVAVSAAEAGASVANYVEVTGLHKDDNGRVCGASLEDKLTGKKFDLKAKVVINATGPFSDAIRKFDDPSTETIVQPSAGTHVVLPDYFSPQHMGLLDPATSDGRVLFFLPWEGKTIAGTTDTKAEITTEPRPLEDEIRFILEEIKGYLHKDVQVRRGDVLSAWSGLRPLVSDPSAADSKAISRNHVVEVSDSSLVTIAGGKWTTYRRMAQDAVDTAVKTGGLEDKASTCKTSKHVLAGGHGWTPTMFIRLIQDYGLDTQVAEHLSQTYGTRAFDVCELCVLSGKEFPVAGRRLVDGFPYIEAEVRFAVKEYACTVTDILTRRTRLAFLNVKAAEAAIPRVVEIMAAELGWGRSRKREETQKAKDYLVQFHGLETSTIKQPSARFSLEELKDFRALFDSIDSGGNGYIGQDDLGTLLGKIGEEASTAQLKELIAEADTNNNGVIEFEEFLVLMDNVRTGKVTNSRLDAVMHKELRVSKRKQGHFFNGGL